MAVPLRPCSPPPLELYGTSIKKRTFFAVSLTEKVTTIRLNVLCI